MAAPVPVPPPTWTRRLQGWSFLLFFLSLIVLTFLAVQFWNAGDLVLSGYLAGLASVAPLLLVVLVFYALPVWGISVPLPPDVVAEAVASAARGRSVEPVAEREGPFAQCVSVVRFVGPACLVGWSTLPTYPKAAPHTGGSTVVLRPETRDRKAVAAFRESLARSLADAARSAV
jgi:hypothetical protein